MALPITSLEESFLQDIFAHPYDDLPRLAYADWLEEHDQDARAACLRAEVAARRILGWQNVHGILDVERHFGVTYTAEQLEDLTMIHFFESTLRTCAASHLLFAGYPLSLNEMSEKHPSLFHTPTGGWYEQEAFAHQQVSLRWYLLRREPVPQSCNKTYGEQVALLTAEEVVPLACAVSYMIVLHWLTHGGERLLPKVYVRCRDMDSVGNRVYVGHFDSDGFDVNSYWDDDRYDDLGLASSRKS